MAVVAAGVAVQAEAGVAVVVMDNTATAIANADAITEVTHRDVDVAGVAGMGDGLCHQKMATDTRRGTLVAVLSLVHYTADSLTIAIVAAVVLAGGSGGCARL